MNGERDREKQREEKLRQQSDSMHDDARRDC
jgi:hypothetical protein